MGCVQRPHREQPGAPPLPPATVEDAGVSWEPQPHERVGLAAASGMAEPQQPAAPGPGAASQGEMAGQTWRGRQVATNLVASHAANVARPDYRKTMPLGLSGHVTPLGTNIRHQLEHSAKRTNKFSSGFNPDHFL